MIRGSNRKGKSLAVNMGRRLSRQWPYYFIKGALERFTIFLLDHLALDPEDLRTENQKWMQPKKIAQFQNCIGVSFKYDSDKYMLHSIVFCNF